jgi:hypothetical protein
MCKNAPSLSILNSHSRTKLRDYKKRDGKRRKKSYAE